MPFAILIADHMQRREKKVMNRITKQFDKSFEIMRRKTWPQIFVGIDIHETVVKPTWTSNIDKEFFSYAKETLQLMSQDPEVNMILWSCSLKELNIMYRDFFKDNDILFDYINENPECKSTVYADFDTKLYFNVGLDDKFGFLPEEDWPILHDYFLKRYYLRSIWKKKEPTTMWQSIVFRFKFTLWKNYSYRKS